MTVFLSYAHQDVETATALRHDLEDMGQSVWVDTTLHGGQIWWDEILRQLRECQVFVLAISENSLASEACLSECDYAVAVNRPFLPIRIDDLDLTSAPERFRSTQHIDYKIGDAASARALAKALNSVPDSVALPAVLPPPPPTPQSYRDRYAALLGSQPLAMDDQMNYFIRLTVDIDTANSGEALELLRALHEREDLSWKVRQAIDRFLEDRGKQFAPPRPVGEGAGGAAGVPLAAPPEVHPSELQPPTPPRRSKRLWWALGAAAAAVVVIVVVVLLTRPDSPPPAVQQPENATCDADNCSGTPIRFFVDLPDEPAPEDITVSLTDPYGDDVARVDAPNERVDGGGLEWTWSAHYDDPIGEYSVSFSDTGPDTIDKTFTVQKTTGPFGVVQQAADAINAQDWALAATIDDRIAEELQNNGEAFLNEEYPADDKKHWLPVDPSGTSNVASTTIIGAYVTYSDATQRTTSQCELWTVKADGLTMRSEPLPLDGVQQQASLTGDVAPEDFTDWIAENCVNAAVGS